LSALEKWFGIPSEVNADSAGNTGNVMMNPKGESTPIC
jgi:hypothetical protein